MGCTTVSTSDGSFDDCQVNAKVALVADMENEKLLEIHESQAAHLHNQRLRPTAN
jgi:hypothetical protein